MSNIDDNSFFDCKNVISKTICEIWFSVQKDNSTNTTEQLECINKTNDIDTIVEKVVCNFYNEMKLFVNKAKLETDENKENCQTQIESDISNDKINKVILEDFMKKKLTKFKSINLNQSEFDNLINNCIIFLNKEFDNNDYHLDWIQFVVDKLQLFYSFIDGQLLLSLKRIEQSDSIFSAMYDIDNRENNNIEITDSELIFSLKFENGNLKKSLEKMNLRNIELENQQQRLNGELNEARQCINQINRDLEEQMSDCFELRSRIDTMNQMEKNYRQSIVNLIEKFVKNPLSEIDTGSVSELITILSDRIESGDATDSVMNECSSGADLMDDSILDLDLFHTGSICLKEHDDDSSITDKTKSRKGKSKLPKLCPNRRKSFIDQNSSFLSSFHLNNSQNESFPLSEELDKLDWDEYDKLESLVEKSFSIFTNSILNISSFVDKNHLNKLTQTTKEFCQILTSKVKNIQLKKVDLNSTCVFEKLEQELQQEICISDLHEQVKLLLTEKENILLEKENLKEQNQQISETLNESFEVIRTFIETINDFYEKNCQEININSKLSADKDINELECLEKLIYARNKLKETENNLKLFSIDFSDKVTLIDSLKSDLNATNQKIIDLQLAIDNRQSENSQFRDIEERKIEQLKKDIENLNEERGRLMDLVSNLEEQNSDLSNQLNIRTIDLETSVEDYVRISEEFEALKKSIEEFNILELKLNEKNRIFEELLEEKTSLLEQEITIKNELEKKLIAQEKELKDYDLQMIKTRTDFQNKIQNNNELIQKLTIELNVFEKNENENNLSLKEELSQLRQDLSRSEEESEKLRNTIETMKLESAEIELQLKNKLMCNISLVTSLESDLNQYKNNEVEEFTNTIQRLETELTDIKEEKEKIEQITLELESKNESLLLLVKKFDLMKEANQLLEESIETVNNSYKEEISFLQSEITNKDQTIKEMKDYLELKKIELKSTEEKLQIIELQLEKDRVEFEMIHNCSIKTETELKAKLEDYISQMESLEANLLLSQNLLKEKENEISNIETIKNHLEETRIKLRHRKHKLTKLQSNFELISQELDDLKMKEEIYKENFEQEKAKYNEEITSLKLKIEVLELESNAMKSGKVTIDNNLQEEIKKLKSELEERDRQMDSHKEALNSFDTLLRHYNDLKIRYRMKRAQFEKIEEKMKELSEENEKLKKLQCKKLNADRFGNSKTDSK